MSLLKSSGRDDPWYREWFGEEYLDLYSYRDESEAKEQVAFFRQHFGSLHGPVLDLACGTGRHMAELTCAGYDATGCDLSFTLLRAGISEYGAMAVARADMRTLPFRDDTFAGLVNFFTSFGYFATEEENAGVVREMARVLEGGGAFLFDYLNVHRELERLVPHEIRGNATIERWFDASDRSFNKRITIGKHHYLERVRGYDLDEIALMFTSCNLTIRHAYGDFRGDRYERTSPRLILLGSKAR